MAPIFESLTLFLCFGLTAIFIALYFYFTRNFKFWQKLGIPYVKPTPFFGNLKECVLKKVNIGKQLQKIYNDHGDKIYVGMFTFDKPSLLIRDLELVKSILVKDSQIFTDHLVTPKEELDPLLGRCIFSLKGEDWRQIRTRLNPVFTSGKIRKMFYLVDTCAKELDEYVERTAADGSPVEVTETMVRFTTDATASCVFGINCNSLKDPDVEFRRYLRSVYDFSFRKALAILAAFFAPNLSTIFNLKICDDITVNYVRNTVWSTVEYRERNGVVRNDLLDCMMELRKKGMNFLQENMQSVRNMTEASEIQIDGDLFVAQAFFLLVAGYETSGITIGYALYELAFHPEIQHRLRTEILVVMNKHNGQLTYDGIQEMAYLDMVVSETLRKYPPLPFLDRTSSKDYELPAPTGNGTVTLPAGAGVCIPLIALHHDPAYYPEPEKFDPDRFTDENKRKRPNYAYMPFGEGPRICLGMRLGLLQVKTALCHMLSRFEVAPCKDTPVPMVNDTKSIVLLLTGKLPLSFLRTQL